MQTPVRLLALLAIAAATTSLHAGDRPGGLRSTAALLKAPVATSTIVLDRAAHRTLTGYAHEKTHELGLRDMVSDAAMMKRVIREAIGRDWRMEDVYDADGEPASDLSDEMRPLLAADILAYAREQIRRRKYRQARLAATFVQRMDVGYGLFDDRPKHVLADLARLVDVGHFSSIEQLQTRNPLIRNSYPRPDPLFAFYDQSSYGHDECADETDVPDHFAVRVVAVEDLDRIRLRSGNQQVTRALAGLLPYSDWPSDLSEDEQKLRDTLLRTVRNQIVGHEFILQAGSFDEPAIELKNPRILNDDDKSSVNLLLLKQGVTVLDPETVYGFGACLAFADLWNDRLRHPIRHREGLFQSRYLARRLSLSMEQRCRKILKDQSASSEFNRLQAISLQIVVRRMARTRF